MNVVRSASYLASSPTLPTSNFPSYQASTDKDLIRSQATQWSLPTLHVRISQTKGPNKIYSVLVKNEQVIEGAVIVRYQPGSMGIP